MLNFLNLYGTGYKDLQFSSLHPLTVVKLLTTGKVRNSKYS